MDIPWKSRHIQNKKGDSTMDGMRSPVRPGTFSNFLASIPGLSSAAQADIARQIQEIEELHRVNEAEVAATRMVALSHRYDWCLTEILPLFALVNQTNELA